MSLVTRIQWRGLLLSALMCLVVGATYEAGLRRNLDETLPDRFRYYGVPIALSADRYGLAGYVSYQEIATMSAGARTLDALLVQLPAAIPDEVRSAAAAGEGLFFVPADDKGDVTYTRLAFWLFGPKTEALYRLYFLLLALSSVAFIVAFFGEPVWLFVGTCALLPVFGLVSAFDYDMLLPDVPTLFDPRIFVVVAMLAILHLGLTATPGHRWTPLRLLSAVWQAGLVVFAIHVRFDSIWLLLVLIVWVAGLASWRRSAGGWPSVATMSVPVGLVSLGLAGLLTIERALYHPSYFTSHMSHHLTWHNIGLGFVLHPQFARTFEFPASDGAMMSKVASSLVVRDDAEALQAVFGSAYSNATGRPQDAKIDVGSFLHSAKSNIARYDQLAKELVYFNITENPIQTLKLFLYYKPRYVAAHVLWFMGLSGSKPALGQSGYPSPLFGGQNRSGFAPLSWFTLTVFVAAFLAMGTPQGGALRSPVLGATAILVLGTIPMLLAYAAPFLMGATLYAATLSIYMWGALALVAVRERGLAASKPLRLDLRRRVKFVTDGLEAYGASMAESPAPATEPAVRSDRWRPRAIDTLLAVVLALVTASCVWYFAPRGFNSGFADMAHDGYQLRQALDLSTGATIFRDTFDQYGPLTPYLNWVGFVTLGGRLLAIKYFVAIWYGMAAAAMFALSRQFLSRTLSVFTVSLWLALAPFYQHGVMISPHAYALVFQATALIVLLRESLATPRASRLWLVGALCGACWLLKQTLGLFFVCSLLAFLTATSVFHHVQRRRAFVQALHIGAGFALVVLPVLAWLFVRGALADWYLQTVVFPRAFYLRDGPAPNMLVSLFSFVTGFVELQWHADGLWLVLRMIILVGCAVTVWSRRPDLKMVLASTVTLFLWLGAFPSANFMHQWWTISLTMCAAVYSLRGMAEAALSAWNVSWVRATTVVTMGTCLLVTGPAIATRWQDARVRSAALSDTITEPTVISGIRTEPETRLALQGLYKAMVEYRKEHPGTLVVSIDSADGDQTGIAESLPLLSFLPDNPHPFPIYWSLPVLSSVIYRQYVPNLQSFMRSKQPLVVDYRLAGWPRRSVPGYHTLATGVTREGTIILYAPGWSTEEILAKQYQGRLGLGQSAAYQVPRPTRQLNDPKTGLSRQALLHTWPLDLLVPTLLPEPEYTDTSVRATRARIVTGDSGVWQVNGTPDTADSYLLQFKPRPLRKGARFIATGELIEGGFTLGLLKDGAWAGFVNVTEAGWFAVVLQIPDDGSYELVWSNQVKPVSPPARWWQTVLRSAGMAVSEPAKVLRNNFRVETSGWIDPPLSRSTLVNP